MFSGYCAESDVDVESPSLRVLKDVDAQLHANETLEQMQRALAQMQTELERAQRARGELKAELKAEILAELRGETTGGGAKQSTKDAGEEEAAVAATGDDAAALQLDDAEEEEAALDGSVWTAPLIVWTAPVGAASSIFLMVLMFINVMIQVGYDPGRFIVVWISRWTPPDSSVKMLFVMTIARKE